MKLVDWWIAAGTFFLLTTCIPGFSRVLYVELTRMIDVAYNYKLSTHYVSVAYINVVVTCYCYHVLMEPGDNVLDSLNRLVSSCLTTSTNYRSHEVR